MIYAVHLNMEGRSIGVDRKLVRIGGSTVIAIPKEFRRILKLKAGDWVRVVTDEHVIAITKKAGREYEVKVR